jgi:Mitochondrial K+-H+ exchange-related
MDVYIVPVGPDRHELYCEVPDEPDTETADAADSDNPDPRGFFRRLRAWAGGFFRRMRASFNEMLAEAERERRLERAGAGGPADRNDHGWLARGKTRLMRWVAESIAEQRLLWHLRRQTTACLFYPDDIDEARAGSLLRSQLKSDYDKHRFWLTIDTTGFVISGLLFFVPGPNIVAYYFAFRLVGHYLSMRGARQGLSGVTWRTERSAPLAELRRAIALEPSARDQHVQDVAIRLRLEHLASFFQRTAVPLS